MLRPEIYELGVETSFWRIDYVHTSLPNNGSNSENDLRVAFGHLYRFTSK
jgi:hypothetical protein